ncbi:MAG: XdhC/CoxI family protein [Opitutus sp.]
MVEIRAILSQLTQLQPVAAALATLVMVEGSSYRRSGARLLVQRDGTRTGSISGGCLEEDLLAHCHAVISSGVPKLVRYDTSSENDLVWGVGLGCHGVVQVFIERIVGTPHWASTLQRNFELHLPTPLTIVWASDDVATQGTHLSEEQPALRLGASVFNEIIQPPLRLFVFGAGDDAKPLVRMAKELGWHVTVADPRRDFATKHRFPAADNLIVGRASDLVKTAAPPADGAVVVMTHHYIHDVPLLTELLARPVAYLGLLGPRKRAAQILGDIEQNAAATPVIPSHANRLHAPVGLDLGAETPEEVALSIIAEIRAVISGRDGRSLRERTGPIHR